MASKNFAANLKIGAVMSSTVGRVFGAINAKIKKQEATLKELRAAYKLAEKGTGEFAGKLDELKAKITSAEKSLAKLKRSSPANIGKSFMGLKDSFLSDTRRLATGIGILTAASLAAGTAVFTVTKGFVDWADDIGDMAEALNMSTQSLQTWQFAAATVGVAGEKMTASIAKFQKAVEKSASGTKKAAEKGKDYTDAFDELGINVARLKKLSLDKQLEVTAEAFKNYEGKTSKSALAMDIFGKSGYQLAGVLSKGRDGLEEFKKAGLDLGAILSDEDAKAAGDAAAALDTFGITMVGLRNQIAIQFVPVLSRLVAKFSGFIRNEGPRIREWAAGFAKTFETKVVPAIERFFDKLPGVITKVVELGSKIFNAADKAQKFVGGWENLGMILLAINFAPTIVALGSLAKSLWGVGAAAVGAMGPIGWTIAAVVALGAAIYYSWTESEKIGNWLETKFPDAYLSFGQAVSDAEYKLTEWGDTISKWWNDNIEQGKRNREAMSRFFADMWTEGKKAVDEIKAAFAEFFGWIEGKWNAVGASIEGMWNKAKDLGNSIRGFFGGTEAPSTTQTSPSDTSQTKKGIGSSVQGFFNGTPEASTATAQIAPVDQMPARDIRTSQTNKVDIHVQTAATDGRAFGQQLRQEIQRKPLFDMDGALVPA